MSRYLPCSNLPLDLMNDVQNRSTADNFYDLFVYVAECVCSKFISIMN